ncbi:MAG TPA: WXG100 family type VII secretion target [Frankiaceae bacterium]|jgi:WXG100 family type VII secretion target
MTNILVTPAQLQTLSGRTHASAAQIAGELASLRGALAPLGSDWAGSAAVAFEALFEEWRRSADGLQQALDGIAQLLQSAGSSYAQAETQIANSFRR